MRPAPIATRTSLHLHERHDTGRYIDRNRGDREGSERDRGCARVQTASTLLPSGSIKNAA
jgi:hypothetical protein